MHEKCGKTGRGLSLFKRPFEQSLSPDNRWVKMAVLVPWDEMAKLFFDSLSELQGRPTVDLRLYKNTYTRSILWVWQKTDKEIKKVLGQQIRYLRRNLTSIEKMLDRLEEHGRVIAWTKAQWRQYWGIQELFRWQDEMYRDRKKRTGNIFLSVFARVMTALIGIKCQLTVLYDNHLRTVFPYGVNSVRFERLRMTF